MSFPISYEDVVAARTRIAPHLETTPVRSYGVLDAAIGHGIRVVVKHENHHPTNAFKVRNALSVMTAMTPEERQRGVVGATRGNHGQGLAWAGRLLGIPVTICVPLGNSPEKNEAMVAFGAELIESGRDYDESVKVADQLVKDRGLTLVHSTNNPRIIAGAATITAELLEQAPDMEAMVVAVGGGSQAVGALVVTRALRPDVAVYAVQASNASAAHDGWHAGRAMRTDSADTFADGLATRSCYDMTFEPLRAGLRGFVTATEADIADAVRLYLRATHNLAEGAGAAGLAGLRVLAPELAGKRVGVILSGSNIDTPILERVLAHEI